MATFPTLGVIARQTSEPPHRVLYAIRKLGIKPTGRAGNALVYAEQDVRRIVDELARTAENQTKRSSTAPVSL